MEREPTASEIVSSHTWLDQDTRDKLEALLNKHIRVAGGAALVSMMFVMRKHKPSTLTEFGEKFLETHGEVWHLPHIATAAIDIIFPSKKPAVQPKRPDAPRSW
ncbi:MAG TPA: hypothetical protein VF777_01330 [Phycisphaerales bacterium]